MYKLVTNDSLVHPLTALPFEGKLEVKGVNTTVLCIPFGEECDTIKKIKEIVNDNVKMAILHVYDGDQLIREYKDYTNLEQITTAKYMVGENEVEILMAKMSRASTIPEQLNKLAEQLQKIEKEKKELEDSYSTFKDSTKKQLTETTNSVVEANNTIKTFVEGAGQTVDNLVKRTGSIENELQTTAQDARSAQGSAEEATRCVQNMRESMNSFVENINTNFEAIGKQEAERSETIAHIEDTVNSLHTEIKGMNEDDMDIDQLKEHRILMSKANLHAYLETATLKSDIHGGVEEEYSITEEKQTQLMAMVMMASMNPDYQPSWNAKGKPCSYDWTADELKYLAGQIEAIVRPLISKQQHMEIDIKDATTVDEVKAVDITF